MKKTYLSIMLISFLSPALLHANTFGYCYGTIQVVSCDHQVGYQECVNYYEGNGCTAVNCLPGDNHMCRASHTPKKIYCLQPFYDKKHCEVRPKVLE